MTQPKKYRKKPIVIEAMEWDGNIRRAHPAARWITENGGIARYTPGTQKEPQKLAIETLEGTMTAEPNDFIIKGVNGEFYPCKPDIFAKTYDVA